MSEEPTEPEVPGEDSGAPAGDSVAPAEENEAPAEALAEDSGAPEKQSSGPVEDSGATAEETGAPAGDSGTRVEDSGASAEDSGAQAEATADDSRAQAEGSGAPTGGTEEKVESKPELVPRTRVQTSDEKKVSSASMPKQGTPRTSDVKVSQSVAEGDKSNVSFVQKTTVDSGLMGKKSSKPSDLGLGKGTSSLRWSGSSRAIPSKAKMSSLISIKRASITSYGDRAKFVRYANSYKLESENPFNVDRVYSIVKHTLVEFLEDDMTYEAEACSNHAKTVSVKLRDAVKEESYDRFKLIAIVTIGEKKSQDMISFIRFLWDADRDRCVHFFHENMYIFVAAAVFGIYFE